MNQSSRDVQRQHLLLRKVALIVKIQGRRIAAGTILDLRKNIMRGIRSIIQFVGFTLERRIYDVVTEYGIEDILVGFGIVVAEIDVMSVRFLPVIHTFLHTADRLVSQVERLRLVRSDLSEVAVRKTIVHAPLRFAVIVFRCKEIFTKRQHRRIGQLRIDQSARFSMTDDDVEHSAQRLVAITFTRILYHLKTDNIFRQECRNLGLRRFHAVDAKLHAAAVC